MQSDLCEAAMLKRIVNIFIAAFLVCWSANAEAYRTRTFVPDLATLRVQYSPSDQLPISYLSRPYLVLNGDAGLDVSFDQLSHEVHYYTYTLRHLDYDWTADDLSPQEYLAGSLTLEITDNEISLNTQQDYTHYRFTFPNEDMRPTISGNYALIIYEDNDPEKVVATACFSVVEPGATIHANVRGNTDIEYSGRYQQLDVEVDLQTPYSSMDNRFAALVVTQNNRTDNAVMNPKPTFVEPQRIRWQNNRALIFEGGNEYRHFDISSEYFMGQGVDHISFDHSVSKEALRCSGYHAFLFEDELRTGGYIYNEDANGRYVINREKRDEDDLEADYMWVHWILPAERWLDGSMYVVGDLFENMLSPQTRMEYDAKHNAYVFTAYMKQGGYEWLYLFYNTRTSASGSAERVEGSYWQTRNSYRLMYYYRGNSDRYTRLLCVENVENALISN